MIGRFSGLAPAAISAFMLCGIASAFANGMPPTSGTTYRPIYTPPQSYPDPSAAAAAAAAQAAAAAANAAAINGDFNPPAPSADQGSAPPPASDAAPLLGAAPPQSPTDNTTATSSQVDSQNSDAPARSTLVTTSQDPTTGDTLRTTVVTETDPNTELTTITTTVRDMTTGMIRSRNVTTVSTGAVTNSAKTVHTFYKSGKAAVTNSNDWNNPVIIPAPSAATLRKQTLQQLGIGN
jgi:hypothetical protein